MKKHQIVTKPTRLGDLYFEELDEGMDDRWQARAERLQARRWRKIKHQEA